MVSYIANVQRGIFRGKRRVYVDKRLPGMEYAQAGILYEPGAEFLVSYETIVAEIDAQGWVHIYDIFSRTTNKHVSRWLKMHGLGYYETMWACNNGLDINAKTHEYRTRVNVPVRKIGVAV